MLLCAVSRQVILRQVPPVDQGGGQEARGQGPRGPGPPRPADPPGLVDRSCTLFNF